MHCSSLNKQQGPLLRPVSSTRPFRQTSAPKPRPGRALQRRVASASAFQDLTHVAQANPLVTGTAAAAGKISQAYVLACNLKILINYSCLQSLEDLLRFSGQHLRLLVWLKALSQVLRHRPPRQLPVPVKMQSLSLALLEGLAQKLSRRFVSHVRPALPTHPWTGIKVSC